MSTPTEVRLETLAKNVGRIEHDLRRSARLTAVVGSLALLLLAGYFTYGYGMIKQLLEPNTLVPYGVSMLEARLPEARQALARQVAASAPDWAEQASVKLRDQIPELRQKLQGYIVAQSDAVIGQAVKVTDEKLRSAIHENRDVLDQGFKELADHEQLSDESLNALVAALETQLQQDLRDESELMLETARMLDARVQRLALGEALDEEEQKERRVLMLARRLQLTEADPSPIAAPDISNAIAERTPVPVTPDQPAAGAAAPEANSSATAAPSVP